MENLIERKKIARKVAASVRAKAHEQSKDDAPSRLSQHISEIIEHRDPGVISGFYPYLSELDVRVAMESLAKRNWVTALPVVMALGQPLVFRAWRPGSPTVPGAWDIPVPEKTASIVTPDVMLVPLLAFDQRGYRLGYGGGFYDRTIAELRNCVNLTTIGIAYSAQEINEVLHDELDEKLDWVVTEKGALDARAADDAASSDEVN